MLKRVLNWIDGNALPLFAGFLLVFIPLYPKWPLFDILYGYNVRVRLEDFLVAFVLVFYLVQFLRKKITLPQTLVTKGLIGYLIIGVVSVVAAVFIVQTIPIQLSHIGKSLLHWLRRAEYFSLFFILFTSIKSNKQIKTYLILFFITYAAVIVYGYGQKYLYWPAFSTMNREFSKGWWLYLTEHARVLSTFGGHYDLAAYLVMTLTLSWSLFFAFKKWWQKLGMGLFLATGFWLLILTASRISFGAYMIALCLVVLFWMFRRGMWWGITRGAVVVFLSLFLMLSFGDLSERFSHLFKMSERLAGVKALLTTPATQAPKNKAMFLENNIIAVTSPSDTPPTPIKPLPADVNLNAPPLLIEIKTASGATQLVERQRTYSQNAVMYDLSTGIRLDATWPRAINGFKANPLTGSGYATLTKLSKEEFTEAESTDNDYLRALGETGVLGFLAFFGTVIFMAFFAFKSLGGITDNNFYGFIAGFAAFVVGLLFNATYIDIFESSKVAYVFWGMSGLAMGSLYINKEKIAENYKPLKLEFSFQRLKDSIKKVFTSDWLWVLLIVGLAFWLRTYRLDTPLADWHSWRQADTSAVSRDFIGAHRINWLYPTYEDLSSIASGKPNPAGLRMVEFPIYNAASFVVKNLAPELNTEEAGRVATIIANVLSLVFIFLLARKFFSRRVAYLAALFFAAMPYNIFYGRVILPDPTMVMFSLGGIWFASEYLDIGKRRYLIFTLIFAAAALLVKPYAGFLLATIGYLMLANIKNNFKRVIVLAAVGALCFLPFLAWRMWIAQFPEGIPASGWLFNGDGIRFKGAFWYWLFADRIGRLMLGYWGLILVGFGLIRPLVGKYKYFALFLILNSIFYLVVFATGNVRHDYYQILLTPSLAIAGGLGIDYLISFNWRSRLLALISFLFMVAFGWYFVKDYFNINHPEIVQAGNAMQAVARDYNDALVVAPYQGDTAFLYQTGHKGWPIMEGTIDEMVKKGAHYYVSTNFDDTTKAILSESWPKGIPLPVNVYKKFKTVEMNDKYVIVQLVPDDKLPR